jgi:hypothetical protein
MNKGPKNVTRLEVLQAIRDTDGRDLIYSIVSDRISTRNLIVSRNFFIWFKKITFKIAISAI